MITILRKIRKKLITEGHLPRYLLYAIGEIALVMIGILLALQVSNWNEERKDAIKESSYLQNIKSDLEIDLDDLKELDKEWTYRISVFVAIDPTFKYWNYIQNDIIRDIDLDSIGVRSVFTRGQSARLSNGTYNAIKDNGDIGLISNEQIYHNIIEIYQTNTASQISIYETIKKSEHELGLKYSKELKYMNAEELFFKHPDREQILADLEIYGRQFMLRQVNLRILIKNIEATIALIHIELNR